VGAPDNTAKPWIGLIAGASAVLIWAGWITVTRYAVAAPELPTDPLVLASCRAGLPALLLAPVIWRRGLLPKGSPLGAIVLMALGWGAPFTLFVGTGLETVPASLFGPLVPGLAPIVVTVLAWGILKERPSRQFLSGLALIGGAMAAILGQWLWQGNLAALGGAPWLMMACLGISVYTVMFRRSRLTAIEATAYISLYSLPMLAFWSLLHPAALAGPSAAEWAFHALTQGLITGVGAVLAYGICIRHLGPVRGSTANALVPVFAALSGIFLLGEALSPLDWVAVIAASLGVAVVNGLFKRRGAEERMPPR